MDCGHCQEALSAAALGGDSGAEAQAFRLHLGICEGCRGELARRREFLASVDGQLLAQFDAAPAADFNARLRRRIADERTRAVRPGLQWLPVLAGVAALAIVLVLFQFHRGAALQPRDSTQVPSAPSAERLAPRVPSDGNSPAPPQEKSAMALSPSERPLLHPVAATRRPPALEVRIDHHELYAVVRLTQAVADGRVEPAALLDSQRQADEPVAAKPLEIPLLELKPIENPALESEPAER